MSCRLTREQLYKLISKGTGMKSGIRSIDESAYPATPSRTTEREDRDWRDRAHERRVDDSSPILKLISHLLGTPLAWTVMLADERESHRRAAPTQCECPASLASRYKAQ